jgi:hypothetical protein
MSYVDRCNGRPIELAGDHQMADRRNVMTAQPEGLFYGASQLAPALAVSELKQLDHSPRALLPAVPHVQGMP